MKNNNMTTFIVVSGIFVVMIFAAVLGVNLLPNFESNSYYTKINSGNAKVETLEIKNKKLHITASGDAIEYCVKSTRTTPSSNNICWKNLDNNTAIVSIYRYKKYYVWVKDINGNISTPTAISASN